MPKRTDNFQKFVKQKKGSAIKEEIRQKKRKEKKERAAAIEAHFERKRAERQQRQQPNTPTETKTSRPNKYPKKAVEINAEKRVNSGYETSKSPASTPSQTKTSRPDKYPKKEVETGAKKAVKGGFETKKSPVSTPPQTKTSRPDKYPKKEVGTKATLPDKGGHETSKLPGSTPPHEITFADKKTTAKTAARPTANAGPLTGAVADVMPLNKYIAHSGICSRRDAANLVKEGKITVNGQLITDPGTKVVPTDVIKVGNKKVTPSRNFVYILLNKPKDYITTSEDPQGRKTVIELVRSATDERVYPVGRLDRNTSGVLLLTNDGDLAQKLSHPKHEIKKVYEVRLDRPLTKGDLEKIAAGITLEDGFIAPDAIAYADPKDKSIIGIEIHSGRNRIVRRIFENLKYDVKGLDRVMFAGLTKKDVQRGKWRLLKEKEIRLLKYMNQSFVKIRE